MIILPFGFLTATGFVFLYNYILKKYLEISYRKEELPKKGGDNNNNNNPQDNH
jgi:hypothetical protein